MIVREATQQTSTMLWNLKKIKKSYMGPTHMDFTWTCTRTQPNLRVVDA